ncbi:MAG: 30S ribosomal protein S3 [Candidatus Kariarchaeaceae archaeon]
MSTAIKHFTRKKVRFQEISEFLSNELKSAEFGGCVIKRSALGDKVVLQVGRVGLAIGRRGKTVRAITETLREKYGLNNPSVEVEDLTNPELIANVMAQRLASSLERGRHYRRSAHGTLRRIMSSGAKGCEIVISGKITSQRARVEKFRDGFVAKCGHPAELFVDKATARAKIQRGILGVTVSIMAPDAVLPDDISIIAEPTYTSRDILNLREIEEEADVLEDLDLADELDVDELESLEDLEDLETLEALEEFEEVELKQDTPPMEVEEFDDSELLKEEGSDKAEDSSFEEE